MEVREFKNLIWGYPRKIAESMSQIYEPAVEACGLTMLQARILMELHICKTHTIGSLGQSICVAGANISAMCKKLEEKGLVERIRNKEDERVVIVTLTEMGKSTMMEIDKMLEDKLSRYLSSETEENIQSIVVGLQSLNKLLQKIRKI